MIQNQTIPTKDSPQLLDLLLDEMATKLGNSLSWLNNTFGKAERIIKKDFLQRPEYQPAIYTGGRKNQDYVLLFPDSHLGNFCWFDVPGTQDLLIEDRRQWNRVRTTAGLIIWYNITKVYPANHTTRTIENVKADVLRAVQTATYTNGSARALSFLERIEDIYRGYSTKEIDRQFMTRPYNAFRLDLEITVRENC
jgi:hypothetical protein